MLSSSVGPWRPLTTPFNFALPLLAGVLYDLSGSYRVVFIIFAALFAIVGAIFSCLYRIELARRDASPGAPVMAPGH